VTRRFDVPSYRYEGDDEREYPYHGGLTVPGDVRSFPKAPDHRWVIEKKAETTPTPTKSAPAADKKD
jgi:hypothetical protein